MATGKLAQIADALLARAATLAVGSPPLPIAYPETEFDPAIEAIDGKYLDIRDFTNAPRWEGMTSGRQDQGLLQITVVWPSGQGVIAPKEAAAAVMAYFPKGLRLFSGSTKVKVSGEPWAAAPITEDDEVRIPVTIPWTA